MSERTGIPLSTLAKVEHDRLTLTYDKLLQLSQRLNLRMSDLFSEADAGADAPITARRSIGRLSNAIRVNTPNYEYFYMCPELRRKRMVPTVTRIRASSVEEFGELVHHPGEEYIYVLQGPVEIHTEFYEPIVSADRRVHLHRQHHGPCLCRAERARRGARARHLLERQRRPHGVADDAARRRAAGQGQG